MFGCEAATVRFAGLNTSKVYFNVLVSLSHSVCIIIIPSEIISNPTIKLIIDYIVLCPLCPTFIGVEAGGGGGGRGGLQPHQILGNSDFWAARENLCKPVFEGVSIFFFLLV